MIKWPKPGWQEEVCHSGGQSSGDRLGLVQDRGGGAMVGLQQPKLSMGWIRIPLVQKSITSLLKIKGVKWN